MVFLVVALNVVLSEYLKYKERKNMRNLKRLLDQAKERLGENNVYGRR